MLLIVEQERLEPRDLAKLETAFLVTGMTEWSSHSCIALSCGIGLS